MEDTPSSSVRGEFGGGDASGGGEASAPATQEVGGGGDGGGGDKDAAGEGRGGRDQDSENDSSSSSSESDADTAESKLTNGARRGRRQRRLERAMPGYRINRHIGHGSYGSVFDATELATGRHVAIKLVRRVFADAVNAKRLLREASILRALRHDNVMRVHRVVPLPSRADFRHLAMVCEFVETDMARLIHSEQFFTNDHIKHFTYALLRGLRFLHAAGVIHRDLKPANLLVNSDCSLKICDFGLARGHGRSDGPFTPPPQQQLPQQQLGGEATPAAVLAIAASASPEPASSASSPPSSSREAAQRAAVASAEIAAAVPLPPPPIRRQKTQHVQTRWYRAPELILEVRDYEGGIDMWSVGCVLAELLSMQKESVASARERAPLFPGDSCFPLSASNPRELSSATDQLNVIFGVIGTPQRADFHAIDGPARTYLERLPPRPAASLTERFPGADPNALDLLRQLLSFDPARRPSAAAAMEHSFFDRHTRARFEADAAPQPVAFDFEDESLSVPQLRARMEAEVDAYESMWRAETAALREAQTAGRHQ